jgi:hypothetical protein
MEEVQEDLGVESWSEEKSVKVASKTWRSKDCFAKVRGGRYSCKAARQQGRKRWE